MTRRFTITQQRALQVSGRSLARTVIPNSGIKQISWTDDGVTPEGFGQLGFVENGEEVDNVTAIVFGQ